MKKSNGFRKFHRELFPGDDVTLKFKVNVRSEIYVCIYPVPDVSDNSDLPF